MRFLIKYEDGDKEHVNFEELMSLIENAKEAGKAGKETKLSNQKGAEEVSTKKKKKKQSPAASAKRAQLDSREKSGSPCAISRSGSSTGGDGGEGEGADSGFA